MGKKYRVRMVIDDDVDADSPAEAKEYVYGMFRDGFYGTRAVILRFHMTARRRKDLEQRD